RVALAQAEELMRARINEKHMRNGVSIINPLSTHISADAQIGRDTVIKPGTIIEGKTIIGEDCIIGPNSNIVNSRIGDRTTVQNSVVTDSSIGEDTAVGPFAHLRPDSQLGNHVKIGNFVEVKKSTLGDDTKVSHLSYIGDAEVGSNVNIGCGSITVNYDGKNKFKTVIEDNVFVGCNSNLVAPVKLGAGSFIAAGSTITKEVPEDALGIARSRQENKIDYAKKLK
ncbi:MAG TPA: DapH/DapD/GlmU-related protein, partial [Ureibacillus sp.]|nr:DapH/DapD/GlmU-related protein [Ureibacillus sp.]